MAAPEIRKGDFIYRDTLFVEVGDGKRHPRAAQSELKDLLLPKKGTTPAKDQVAHWYEAQLIHYGLTRSKDKNTAKVRLTAALSTDGLKVPTEVQRKEAELKKEYAAATRKLKAAEKKAPALSADSPKGRKRKADDGTSTTISLKVDGVELTIDRKTGNVKDKTSKKFKTGTKEMAKATPKPKPLKATTASTARSQAQAKPPSAVPSNRPKQTARRSRPGPQYPSTSSRPATGSQSFSDHTPTSFHDVSDDDDGAPPAYDSLDFSRDERSPPSVQISGSYNIESDQSTSYLTLRIDKSKQQLWGRFEIGSIEGVLFMDSIDRLPSGDTKMFSWRAEDTYHQQYYFRRNQTGWMEFDGNGSVRGSFSGLMLGEDVGFEGQLVDEDALDIPAFQSEWDKIPRMAYGKANN